jgi:thiol:disulfide interchange protein DsbA
MSLTTPVMASMFRMLVLLACISAANVFSAQPGTTVAVLAAGQTYREIPQQPIATPGRIEVIDFFFYACPYCNELRPMLEKWRKALPTDVAFRRVPAVRRDEWVPLARTYYTLQALREDERLHEQVYINYHDDELHMSKPDVMADWAAKHGIDRQKWWDTYHSSEISAKVDEARRMTRDYDIQGTPSLVIAGRYLTSSGLTDDVKMVVPVAEALIEKVRSGR